MADSIQSGPPVLANRESQSEALSAEDDEAALIARAKTDRQAFAPLYASYADPVYRYCYRRLGSHDAAADATSQTFVKVLAALPRYRAGSFRAWLFTIAANTVSDLHRHRIPDVPLAAAMTDSLVDAAPTPEEAVLAAEAGRSIAALLARLTPDQRQVVELRLAGLTGAEVATVLGRGIGAVRSSQFRAYARLRRLMGTEGSEGDEL